MRYVLLVLALTACAKPRPHSEPAPPRTVVARIAMIPAHFDEVAWYVPAQGALFTWMDGLSAGVPACVGEIRAGLDGYVQATDHVTPGSVLIFQGKIEREQVEACAPQLGQRIGLDVSVARDGAITVLETSEGARTHLGWMASGDVVQHDDRAMVEAVMSGKNSLRDNPAMMALVGHADTSQPLWGVSTRDLGTPLFGVPARGWIIAGEIKPGSPLPVTLVFSGPEEAQQVIEKLRAMASDERFSPALRATIDASQPTAKGSDVTLDVMVFIAAMTKDPALMTELQGLLDQATK